MTCSWGPHTLPNWFLTALRLHYLSTQPHFVQVPRRSFHLICKLNQLLRSRSTPCYGFTVRGNLILLVGFSKHFSNPMNLGFFYSNRSLISFGGFLAWNDPINAVFLSCSRVMLMWVATCLLFCDSSTYTLREEWGFRPILFNNWQTVANKQTPALHRWPCAVVLLGLPCLDWGRQLSFCILLFQTMIFRLLRICSCAYFQFRQKLGSPSAINSSANLIPQVAEWQNND